VQAYLEAQRGGVQVEFLPAYAPELNPVEHLWGYLKAHEVSNLCVANFGQLTTFARNRLRSPRAPTHTGTRFLEAGRATTMNVH
jgi:transposase